MFKQEHDVVYTLKTIASAGGVSVVDKAYTTLKAFTAFTLAEVLIVLGIRKRNSDTLAHIKKAPSVPFQ